jgi:hypothetical protein
MFLASVFRIDPISIILVVGFVCAIISGAFRGFFHVLIDLGQSILSLIVSVVLAKPFGMLLYNTGYFSKLITKTSNLLVERDEIFTQIITSDNKADILSQAFDKLNIPDKLNSVMISVGEKIIPETNNMKISDFISEALFVGVAIFLAATFLYLLIFILVLILRIFVRKLDEIKPIRKLNHFLGGLVGAVNGVIFVLVALAILTGILMIPSLNETVGNMIKLNDDSSITLAEFLYKLDIFSYILRLLGFK